MVVAIANSVSPEEYLERENLAETKSELIEGEIIEMAGASANHNRLTVNLSRLLPLTIGDRDAEIFISDMRLWLPRSQSYVYPDVMVVKGEPNFTDSKQMALTNPCLIAEVLSASTESYDKTSKFALYRAIPELKEYVIIDQWQYRVELYSRVGDRQWLLTEIMGKESVLELKSVELEMSLEDLYKRVKFEDFRGS